MKQSPTTTGFVRALAPLALAALTLGGCISLFPKSKPAQLYRFSAPAPASAPVIPSTGTFSVKLAPVGFPIAAASDRILTVDGERVAYISSGRWVTSAVSLFETAVVQTFDMRGGPARLIGRGELSAAPYILKLDVRRFEARYDHGLAAAPTVLVEVYAALDSPADATRDRERIFVERVAAADNRMGPIIAAYDEAVLKACADVVDWVNRKGAS